MRVNEPVTDREVEWDDGALIVSKTDLGGRITFVNQTFVEISGFTEKELIGQPHNILRHPDMPAVAFADLWATIKAGRPWEGLVKNRTKRGDYYWVHANVTPIMENGEISGYISVRTKAPRDGVKAAEQLYRDIREGRAKNILLKEGEVFTKTVGARFALLSRSLKGRILALAGVLMAVSVIAGGIGLVGMADSNEELEAAHAETFVPTARLGEVSALLDQGMMRSMARQIDPAASADPAAPVRAADKVWAEFAAAAHTAEETALVERFAAQRQHLAALGFGNPSTAWTPALGSAFEQSRQTLAALADLQGRRAERHLAEARSDLSIHMAGGVLAIAFGVIATLVMMRMLVRSIRAPLSRMENHFAAIARGDAVHEIASEPIAEFTRATSMLRAMKAMLVFGAAQTAESSRRAEEFLKREMLTLTEVLEGEVQETVNDISTQASRLSENAFRLNQIASGLKEAADEVTASIQTTSDNVQTVASATAELEASSRAILSQAGNSSTLADQARRQVEEANGRVAGLTEASHRIGDVVSMIQTIAGQTRMLALNATIEAARAGEAGKGFAVVADEVKGLANQTEQGIATVSTQAEDIGRTTDETVETVSAVAGSIRDIQAMVAEVAHAADEQRSATAEIMSSALQAADHTRQVADRVIAMIEGVEATGATATRVTSLSAMVTRDIAALQRRLSVILRSSYGGDRRSTGRVPVAIRFHAKFDDCEFDGYTGDLSVNGALLIVGSKDLPHLDRGTVDLDGIGKLSARFLSDSVVGLHVRLDEIGPNERRTLEARIARAQEDDRPYVALATSVAAQAAERLQQSLTQGRISMEDLFDINYQVIPGTDPLQLMAHHTELAEELFPSLIESPLERDQRIVFCCITDRNGYIAAHNAKYSHPQRTDDPLWNAANCRNRRSYDDRAGILAAHNTKPSLAQTYARDMGGGKFVLLKEIDTPITVAGRHWGSVRMALKLG